MSDMLKLWHFLGTYSGIIRIFSINQGPTLEEDLMGRLFGVFLSLRTFLYLKRALRYSATKLTRGATL